MRSFAFCTIKRLCPGIVCNDIWLCYVRLLRYLVVLLSLLLLGDSCIISECVSCSPCISSSVCVLHFSVLVFVSALFVYSVIYSRAFDYFVAVRWVFFYRLSLRPLLAFHNIHPLLMCPNMSIGLVRLFAFLISLLLLTFISYLYVSYSTFISPFVCVLHSSVFTIFCVTWVFQCPCVEGSTNWTAVLPSR